MNAEDWIAGTTAFVVSFIATLIVRFLAQRLNLFDPPGPLKIHNRSVPRLGGVGLGVAALAGLGVSRMMLSNSGVAFPLGLGIICSVGVIDDLLGLSPAVRLSAQVGCGLLLYQFGWRIPFLRAGIPCLLATCFVVAIFVNSFNFLDGADGLAVGVAFVIALGYAVLRGTAGPFASHVAWSVLGGCAAFLLFNFPPASIFLGDSGSTLLGFVFAFLSLDFCKVNSRVGFHLVLPWVWAGLPLLDAFFAVFRRVRSGVSPFAGDRQHFYDLLLDRGWSARQVAFGSSGITGLLVIEGWACMHTHTPAALLLTLITLCALLVFAVRMGSLRPSSPGKVVDSRMLLADTFRAAAAGSANDPVRK